MSEPIRVPIPDEQTASALDGALAGAFRTELVRNDGHFEVLVHADRAPDRLVVDVLDRLERWLYEFGLAHATVIVGGRSYTLAGAFRAEASGDVSRDGYQH